MKQDVNKDEQVDWRASTSLASIGIELAASVLIGAFLGNRLDLYFHTKPWLMVVGLFVGAAAGFYSIYKQVAAVSREEDQRRPK
jgi:ATP synthase protein I